MVCVTDSYIYVYMRVGERSFVSTFLKWIQILSFTFHSLPTVMLPEMRLASFVKSAIAAIGIPQFATVSQVVSREQ